MEYMESKMQDHYESGSALLDELERLKSDRDLILAELQKANATIIDLQRNPPKLANELIAEIKAEAGMAGFIAGAEMWSDYGVKSRYKDDYLVDIEADASKYAEKIRKGGTWLKDSNVNGGKRQGGEK